MSGYVCPECGLDYDTISPPDAKVALASFPRRYRQELAGALDDSEAGDALIRRRPAAETWSALEYTAHVADLDEVFADIVDRMYREDKPSLTMFDPDEKAATDRYDEQDPQAVLARLAANTDRLVAAIGRVDADAWHRTASFPWGERDLLTMVRNAVHEGSHHLRDVQHVLAAARAARP
jgi:hypothetical protein